MTDSILAANVALAELAIDKALASPCTSHWLKTALLALMDRDCVDAAADACTLYQLIEARTAAVMRAGHLED